MRLFLLLITFIFFNVFFTKIYCQKKDEIGVNFQIERIPKLIEDVIPGATKTSQTNWNFSFGVLYERIFSKHSSGEIGLKYRHVINEIAFPIPVGTNYMDYVHYYIIENFLSLPVQYKYSSRIINLSAGPSFDYFLSWKQQKEKSYFVPLQSYKLFFDRKLSVGLLTTISKTIKLDKKIIIEPSIYYNPILSFKRNYYGVSMATKYEL